MCKNKEIFTGIPSMDHNGGVGYKRKYMYAPLHASTCLISLCGYLMCVNYTPTCTALKKWYYQLDSSVDPIIRMAYPF